MGFVMHRLAAGPDPDDTNYERQGTGLLNFTSVVLRTRLPNNYQLAAGLNHQMRNL
jgi:hypothetical protein